MIQFQNVVNIKKSLKLKLIKNKTLNIHFNKEIKSSYNKTCKENTTCESGVNLVCTNKTCLCSSPGTQYWNEFFCGNLLL